MNRKKYGEKRIVKTKLERWPNPFVEKDYNIEISFPEFTCICPRSGYPDFATIKINYIPDKYIVELKSLKLFLNRFRDQRLSHESATNQVFDSLKNLLRPRYLEVIGDFNPRGNVKTVVRVTT